MNSSNIHVLSVEFYRFGLSFNVQGETSVYTVDWNIYKGWICDCRDHLYRKRVCKHIRACHDYTIDKGLFLHWKLWCDDPKADMEVAA